MQQRTFLCIAERDMHKMPYLCSMNYGKIIVIDDNPAILTAVRICLTGVFEKILTLSSPEGVLIQLEKEHTDVILMDMNFTLGVNTGQEGLTWLSAIHRRFPDIPIVLITAYGDVKLAVRALKSGASDFVTKPWDNDELIRILKDAIDKSRHMKTLEQVEAEHMRRAMEISEGNLSKAADLLGISRQTLYRKMK